MKDLTSLKPLEQEAKDFLNEAIMKKDELSLFNSKTATLESRYSAGLKKFLFTSEADAARYCKAQMMKNLFGLIKTAKDRIKDVEQFRLKNFELLNHQWTEEQINNLARVEAESL